MIGSRARTVSGVIPSKSARSQAHHSKTLIIDQLRSIEDNVRATCGELVFECIVVGNGRSSPALFVEASEKCTWTLRNSRRKSSGERGSSTLAAISTSASPPPNTSSSSSVALFPAPLPRVTSEDRQLRTSTRSCSMASTVLFQNIERSYGAAARCLLVKERDMWCVVVC
jgi:hypothetical protein